MTYHYRMRPSILFVFVKPSHNRMVSFDCAQPEAAQNYGKDRLAYDGQRDTPKP